MLKDEDRIFKNLYNDLGWNIDAAENRGDKGGCIFRWYLMGAISAIFCPFLTRNSVLFRRKQLHPFFVGFVYFFRHV